MNREEVLSRLPTALIADDTDVATPVQNSFAKFLESLRYTPENDARTPKRKKKLHVQPDKSVSVYDVNGDAEVTQPFTSTGTQRFFYE